MYSFSACSRHSHPSLNSAPPSHHSSAPGLKGMYIDSVFLSYPLPPPPSALSLALSSILSILFFLSEHPTPPLACCSCPPVYPLSNSAFLNLALPLNVVWVWFVFVYIVADWKPLHHNIKTCWACTGARRNGYKKKTNQFVKKSRTPQSMCDSGKNVMLKLSKKIKYDSSKERGKGSCCQCIIVIMSYQLLHDSDKIIPCECPTPPPSQQVPHIHLSSCAFEPSSFSWPPNFSSQPTPTAPLLLRLFNLLAWWFLLLFLFLISSFALHCLHRLRSPPIPQTLPTQQLPQKARDTGRSAHSFLPAPPWFPPSLAQHLETNLNPNFEDFCSAQDTYFCATKTSFLIFCDFELWRWGWVCFERTRILTGIQFTRHFIELVVVELKRLVNSNVNVILTQQTYGHRSSRAARSKRRALTFFFSIRIFHTKYMFCGSKFKGESNLDP